MSDALNDIAKLRKVVENAAGEIDLILNGFSVQPAIPNTPVPDLVIATFMITPEAVESAEQTEQRKVDAEFEAMMNGSLGDTELNPLDDKMKDKVEGLDEDLKKWLEKGD